MSNDGSLNKVERVFARLAQRLSATSNAQEAASIIMEAADTLLGWDACYVILYDPEEGRRPRPLLAVDLVNGKRTILKNVAPERPSPNMQRAIHEGGFIKPANAPASSDPAFRFGDASRSADSGMFVPVRSGKRVIGVLSIQRYTAGVYNQNSMQTLKVLANQCAGALERIWAQEQLSVMAERRAILYDATQTISASLDLEQLYESIYKAVKKVMPCDDFIFSSYDEMTNEIVALYVIEYPHNRVHPPRYFADHGLAGDIIQNGKPQLLNSIDEMDASGIQFEVTGTADKTQSILAIPMMLQGKVKGMISAQSYQAYAYTKDDQNLLEMLAAHAAVAIENAHLFAEMQQMADNDPLTQLLLNRRKFYELAEREFARIQRYPEPLSVIMFDVDHFKGFNDQFGHKVGDMMLRTIAEKCRNCVRDVDFVGRHGGEEFILMLPATGLNAAVEVAERLRQQVEHADLKDLYQFFEMMTGTQHSRESMKTTISIGVAEVDDSCTSIDILVDHADRAMYLAKNEGRNRVKAWLKTEFA